jgi:hypothetical protein
MATQVWVNPNPPTGVFTKKDIVYVDSSVAPVVSPSIGNHFVPDGYVKQMGQEGGQDSVLLDLRSGQPVYRANLTTIKVPVDGGVGIPPYPHDTQGKVGGL